VHSGQIRPRIRGPHQGLKGHGDARRQDGCRSGTGMRWDGICKQTSSGVTNPQVQVMGRHQYHNPHVTSNCAQSSHFLRFISYHSSFLRLLSKRTRKKSNLISPAGYKQPYSTQTTQLGNVSSQLLFAFSPNLPCHAMPSRVALPMYEDLQPEKRRSA
jgi:hypothetical protein